MLKLQDFAALKGVTDKAIYKHLQKHSAELSGHIEKRGKNGTWLDDFAQEFISGLMISTPPAIIEKHPDQEELERLREQNEKLQDRLEQKENYIGQLEAAAIIKQKRLDVLESEKLQIEAKTQEKVDAAVDQKQKDMMIIIENLKEVAEIEGRRKGELQEKIDEQGELLKEQNTQIGELRKANKGLEAEKTRAEELQKKLDALESKSIIEVIRDRIFRKKEG